MSQELMQFIYSDSGADIRAVDIDGEPWFVAADVAKVLELTNTSVAVANLDDDERAKLNLGRQGFTNIVNEFGLTAMVLQSRKPNAKAFKRWIIHEVIPAIRKTGSYSIQPVNPYEELLPKSFPEALRQLAQTHERVEMLDTKVRELTPKADSFDEFMASDGTEGVGKVGKMFDIGEVKFFEMLREGGIFISKGAMRNTPYQQYMHHFLVKAKAIKHRDGSVSMAHTTYVKPSGVDFIGRKLGLTRVSEQLELFEGGDAA